MEIDHISARIVLFENSIFAAILATNKMLSTCSDNCRKGIKNGPNYTSQVQCCTSTCKIRCYSKIINTLQSLKQTNVNQGILNKKISYFSQQMQKEKMKYQQYRNQLKKRQTKVPSSLSLKPSPERWNPRALN